MPSDYLTGTVQAHGAAGAAGQRSPGGARPQRSAPSSPGSARRTSFGNIASSSEQLQDREEWGFDPSLSLPLVTDSESDSDCEGGGGAAASEAESEEPTNEDWDDWCDAGRRRI